MRILANSFRAFFLAQFTFRFVTWTMFMVTGTFYAGPWPVKTANQTPGLGLTSNTVPVNRSCPDSHSAPAQGLLGFEYDTCPPGGLCDMADDMAKGMTLDQVDMIGALLVIPLLLSDADVIKMVPWGAFAIVPQIISFAWVAFEGNMSHTAKLIQFPAFTILLLWGILCAHANGNKAPWPLKLSELSIDNGCKRYICFEGVLMLSIGTVFCFPTLSAGLLGDIGSHKHLPCLKMSGCENVDRVCTAAHTISKIYAGSCWHWSFYYPGILTLSRDGLLKMTFWVATLWCLDVYPGWIVGYIKAIYWPNLFGATLCFFLWGFIAPAYPYYHLYKENQKSRIQRGIGFFFTPAQEDEDENGDCGAGMSIQSGDIEHQKLLK